MSIYIRPINSLYGAHLSRSRPQPPRITGAAHATYPVSDELCGHAPSRQYAHLFSHQINFSEKVPQLSMVHVLYSDPSCGVSFMQSLKQHTEQCHDANAPHPCADTRFSSMQFAGQWGSLVPCLVQVSPSDGDSKRRNTAGMRRSMSLAPSFGRGVQDGASW